MDARATKLYELERLLVEAYNEINEFLQDAVAEIDITRLIRARTRLYEARHMLNEID